MQDLYVHQSSLRDEAQKNVETLKAWSFVMRVISETAQANLSSLDPDILSDAIHYMQRFRGFITVGPADAVVTINGDRFTLLAGLTYCAAPEEVQTILNQSAVNDLGLLLGDFTTFQASPTIQSFFS